MLQINNILDIKTDKLDLKEISQYSKPVLNNYSDYDNGNKELALENMVKEYYTLYENCHYLYVNTFFKFQDYRIKTKRNIKYTHIIYILIILGLLYVRQ